MTADQLSIVAAGLFFLTALLTGVWKYVQIASSEEAKAHPYVDIAHRASLMYSFAAILLAEFAKISQLPERVELIAAALPLAYFAMATVGYVIQGLAKKTDNQFRNAHPSLGWFMWTLIVAEIGGFIVLFYGVLSAIFQRAS